MNKSDVVVAGPPGHVHTRHLYLSTCAHTVVLDTSRRKADLGFAVCPQARLTLNFQVYDLTHPQRM